MNKFLTKRFALSVVGLGLATWLCYLGKVGGSEWVYALITILAGHHAEDLIKVYKNVGTPQTNPN